MYNNAFSIEYDDNSPYVGSLSDSVNDGVLAHTLESSLNTMFNIDHHKAGVLIAEGYSYGLIRNADKYYFTNSHSCGAVGGKARGPNGKACVIECDTFDELLRVCKRATGSKNVQYTVNYIDVRVIDNIVRNYGIDQEAATQQSGRLETSQAEEVPLIQTSLMAPIDCAEPNVEDEIEISVNDNEIRRKTKDNIVNEAHELKAEEYTWYFLFPYGKNGLREQRDVPITPLDYFQYRILGSDTRFQRNEYLFYALSMFEYLRVKSTITACGRNIEGEHGMVDDIHLYLKNLRG